MLKKEMNMRDDKIAILIKKANLEFDKLSNRILEMCIRDRRHDGAEPEAGQPAAPGGDDRGGHPLSRSLHDHRSDPQVQ